MTSKPKSKSKELPRTSAWEATKIFFKRSESIFLARMLALGGTITTFVGSLDFSPFWSLFSTGTDFTSKQLLWIGVSVFGVGLTLEMARRRNAGDL